jgi:hypothetical protein
MHHVELYCQQAGKADEIPYVLAFVCLHEEEKSKGT